MDQNEQDIMLASHDELLRRLMILTIKMDATIDRLESKVDKIDTYIQVVTELLQRKNEGEDTNGRN